MQPTALPKASLILAAVALTLAALPAVAAGPVQVPVGVQGPPPGCDVIYLDGQSVSVHLDCLVSIPFVDEVIGIVCGIAGC